MAARLLAVPVVEDVMRDLQPEAVYFTAQD
jgi:hypothetical protein